MSASQSHKGVTITASNAYSILLDILNDAGSLSDAKISACMSFLGGETISKEYVVNTIQSKLDTYYANGQLTVAVSEVLDLEEA